MEKPSTLIHWFRKGLRIHDNPALQRCIDLIAANPDKYYLRPIFILDPGIRQWLKVGPNRWRFLQESLKQLDDNLKSINSRLFVIRGNPREIFPKLFSNWNVSHLTFESDIEPYARERDIFVEKQAKSFGVTVLQENSHTIYDPMVIAQKTQGQPVMQMQKFLSIVADLKAPDPINTPNRLPENTIPKDDISNSCYDIPSLQELGIKNTDCGPHLYPGGETEGLNRMKRYLKQTKWICSFEKPNTSPNSLEPSTTVLSPYFKFGCLSSRLFYHELNRILAKNRNHTKPPVSLVGQMMWREFYYAAAALEPRFDRMIGNSICRQISWQAAPEHLAAWTYGRTGYPFIDAIMRQLRQEGWIHHLARHAVACFLTRGDLWISWEEGQRVFEELLLDADWALNAGNWMWLSASAFFYQYFRVYSPVAFGKKTDKNGSYIRKYVPELKFYPNELIYEPWKAELCLQKQYKCVLGIDYPDRIVIHEIVYKENLSRMAQAYKEHHSLTLPEPEMIEKKLLKIKNESNTSSESKCQPNTSKRQRTQSNTLKNYFKKEPKSPE